MFIILYETSGARRAYSQVSGIIANASMDAISSSAMAYTQIHGSPRGRKKQSPKLQTGFVRLARFPA